jgi:hypothetical protein
MRRSEQRLVIASDRRGSLPRPLTLTRSQIAYMLPLVDVPIGWDVGGVSTSRPFPICTFPYMVA